MIRRLPIIPTTLVLAAVAVMVWLGIWQLGRAEEKAVLLSTYEQALGDPQIVDIEYGYAGLDYRTVRIECENPYNWEGVAGRSERGQTGYVHRYACSTNRPADLAGEPIRATSVVVGWSLSPEDPGFSGGLIEGVMLSLIHI